VKSGGKRLAKQRTGENHERNWKRERLIKGKKIRDGKKLANLSGKFGQIARLWGGKLCVLEEEGDTMNTS